MLSTMCMISWSYAERITLNPKKFKFARKEIDYVGYESYRPTDDMLAAITNFLMPDEPSISDICAWFGLVNQLAPFLASA